MKLSDGSASPAHSHVRPILANTNAKLGMDTIDVMTSRDAHEHLPMTALESAARQLISNLGRS